MGMACLIWVSANWVRATAYQAEQQARLVRLSSTNERLVPDPVLVDVVEPHEGAPPIGRLEIPRIGLSAVVMEGDDETTLKAAVGHLPDTAFPWQEGNAALAGHRDTFVRPLRRVQNDDEIRLVTPRGTFRYRATRQLVVDPDELWVLDPSPAATLTLITCYPFDFVGQAPRRVCCPRRTHRRDEWSAADRCSSAGR
jgi:LPXTG-site transpeptidase (sortase) family protein